MVQVDIRHSEVRNLRCAWAGQPISLGRASKIKLQIGLGWAENLTSLAV